MSQPTWWGTREKVSARMMMEHDAMRTCFGTTFTLNVPQWGSLYWTGTITMNLKGVESREHSLKILYPAQFPIMPPEAHIIRPHIEYRAHQYPNGHLSLFDPRQGENYGWNPAYSSAATITGWAIQWLYCYYTWKLKGKWPEFPSEIKK